MRGSGALAQIKTSSLPFSEISSTQEYPLYGSTRLGIFNHIDSLRLIAFNSPGFDADGSFLDKTAVDTLSQTAPSDSCGIAFLRGIKRFELSNHLGNVLAVISDRKLQVLDANMTLGHYFAADIWASTDYYPFGSQLMGRSWQAGRYRFGFNGKETDEETGLQDYGFRIYHPAISKFLSVDPLAPDYPWYTPYQFAGNTPIQAVDVDGLEPSPAQVAQYIDENRTKLKPGTVITISTRYGPGNMLVGVDIKTHTPLNPKSNITVPTLINSSNQQRNDVPGEYYPTSDYSPNILLLKDIPAVYVQGMEQYVKAYAERSRRIMGTAKEEINSLNNPVILTVEMGAEGLTTLLDASLAIYYAYDGEYLASGTHAAGVFLFGSARSFPIYKLEALPKAAQRKVDTFTNLFKEQEGWGEIEAIKIFESPSGSHFLLDGHHRFNAAQNADIGVKYELVPEEDLPRYGYSSPEEVYDAASNVGRDKVD